MWALCSGGVLSLASDVALQPSRLLPLTIRLRYIAITSLKLISMPALKTATLNLRIDPGLKEAARVAAIQEHRSVANLIEILIRRHCDAAGISIPEQVELFKETGDE